MSLYLIAGLGKTGLSVARYLQKRSKDFIFFDTREMPPDLPEIRAKFSTQIFLQHIPPDLYPKISEIIISPGVPLDNDNIKKAIDLNIPVRSDIEWFAREQQAPVIAITGTNGKSTVTTLVGDILKAASKRVAVCGNIGTPVLDLLDDGGHYDIWVLELSSFQLETTYSLEPIAATILNITPDHFDRHHTFAAYKKIKQQIYSNAKNIIYNRDDASTFPDISQTSSIVSFGLDTPEYGQWGILKKNSEIYLTYNDTYLISVNELKIKGKHNWQNALAACALTQFVGIDHQYMVAVLNSFTGLPHRSQLVRTINQVDWINDSKGTNIGATISSLVGLGDAITGKIVLIAGGQGKGADFNALRDSVQNYVRSIILIGEDADKIAIALQDIVNIYRAKSLQEAVQIAKSIAIPQDIVLLSPACASYDMFNDFNHRGDCFIEVVNAL